MKTMLIELYKYIKPYKYKVLFGLFLLVIAASLEILNPKLFGWIIDDLNTKPVSLNHIYQLSIVIILIMFVRGIFLYYARYLLIGLSRRMEYDFRNNIFNHLLKLESAFYDKNKIGDIISRMTSDLEQIRMIFGPGIMYLFNVVFLFILAITSMSLIDIPLTLISIVPLILLVYIIRKIGKKYYDRSYEVQEEIAKMTTFVNENLQGIRVIKSFVKEGFINDFFRKINLQFIKKNLELAKVSGIFRPLLYLIAGFSSLVILWIGGYRVVDKQMTIGQLIEYLRYIEVLSLPLLSLGWVISIYQRGHAAYQRINRIIEIQPQITDEKSFSYITSLKGDIEIKNLSFSYDNEHTILDDISFQIRQGEKLSIIGPTGAGKTTLISLLLRLYEAPPNTLFIGDIPIHHIPLKTLRNHIRYVPQDNYIFPDTILENIRFGGKIQNDLSHIAEMSKLSRLNDEIEAFPNQYSELLGERGITLSGGQKQRLSIARALTGDPKVMIFDDSFSNIDSDTEKQILENIYSYFTDETVIIIAHRASTIQNVDRIIVLDHGSIKEMGTPEELIQLNGYYAHLLQQEILSHDLQTL